MNLRTIKPEQPRIDVRYLSQYNIKSYDFDNIYPQKISDIISSSAIGSTCLERYARFIEGNGFKSDTLSKTEINTKDETLDDLLHLAVEDLARYGGFALHVNYDAFGKIVEIQHVPFESCRLVEDDDSGYIGHICTHPDWRGRKTRNGKLMRVNKENMQFFNVFNPIPEVVAAQIKSAGGIDRYCGQILWVSAYGKMRYPLAKYDSALVDISTDVGLSNVKQRNVRNNFLTSCIIVDKRGQSLDDELHDDNIVNEGFANQIRDFQGDERASSIMLMTIGSDEEKPEIMEFPTKNFDKDFSVTDQSVTARIYGVFEQEPFLAIKNGKLGFSGDVIEDAYNYYSSVTNRERRIIERSFCELFKSCENETLIDADAEIEPLKFIKSETETTPKAVEVTPELTNENEDGTTANFN